MWVVMALLCAASSANSLSSARVASHGSHGVARWPNRKLQSPKAGIQHMFLPCVCPSATLTLRGGATSMLIGIPSLDPAVGRLTFDSMAELMTSCAIGFTATKVGLFDGPAIRSLARVVFNIFLPSMLLTSVANTVAQQASMGVLMVVPLTAWIQVVLGMTIGLAISSLLLRLPRTSAAGRGITVLSGFGNSGVLPLIFVNSLFRGAAQQATRQRATSMVAMYLLGWSPLFWTLGFALLTGQLVSSPERTGGEHGAGETATADATDATAVSRASSWRRGTLAGLQRALSPPIIACLIGLIIGSTPFLRQLFLPTAAGMASPLPLYRCFENLGRAYSPAALLVLAGSLAAPTDGTRAQENELGHSPSHVLAISLARFLLVPLGSFGLLQQALRLGWLPVDPLRDFVLLLQSCMPSAQNAVLAYQVSGAPSRAANMARILLAIYLVAALPVAGVLSLLLQRYSSGIGLAALSL